MKIVFSSNSREDDDRLLGHTLPDGRRKALIGAHFANERSTTGMPDS